MINKYSFINIYEYKKKNSKLSSQILYGEKFTILNRAKNWVKIRTSYDNYIGYIKKNKFNKNFKLKHKINKLK